MFAEPVIEAKHGGTAGGGAELIPLGHRVVERYRSIEAKAHAVAATDLAELAAATVTPAPSGRKPAPRSSGGRGYGNTVKPLFSKLGRAAAEVGKSSSWRASGLLLLAVRAIG